MYELSIGEQTIEVRIREQADGSLFVSYGAESHQLYAKEEPLGLRMVLDGVTVLLPTIYDPSELRSDITGKLVRYLVDDGAEVSAGQPYAEAEAMKMLITIKSEEAGKVSHAKQPGSIINQGDLLGSLTLADPSKVKKILNYDGELQYALGSDSSESTLKAFRSSQKALELIMDGYELDDPEIELGKMLAALSSVSLAVEEVADAASMLGQKLPAELDAMLQRAYEDTLAQHVEGGDTKETAVLSETLRETIDDYVGSQLEAKREGIYATLAPISAVIDKFLAGLRENAINVVCAVLSRYMAVESSFVNLSTDQAIAALVKANPNALDTVYAAALAHEQLVGRSALCNSMMRQLSVFPERFGVQPLRDLPPALDVVVQLSQLPGAAYKEVALTAAKFGLMKAEKPFDEAVAELKAELKSNGVESTAGLRSVVTNALLELARDADVGLTAMQVAIKRWYRTYDIKEMATSKSADASLVEFTYMSSDVSVEGTVYPERYGQFALVHDVDALTSKLGDLVAGLKCEGPAPNNVLHIALETGVADGAGAEEELIQTATQALETVKSQLEAKGIRLVSLMVPNAPQRPRQFSFPLASGYTEVEARRNMNPTMFNLLELERLQNWTPERMPSINHNSVVLLGTQGVKPRMQQRVFVRGITHSSGLEDVSNAEAAMQKALDELQFAVLDKSVVPSASSHLFLHILAPFEIGGEAIIDKWNELMPTLISRFATRLLKLRVDEIEVRAHVSNPDGTRQAVRLVASSMAGQWLKTDGYLEYLDPVTGQTQAYCSPGEEETCFIEPYPVSSALSTKRSIARRIGTTYAYDFLGLIEKALVADWQLAIDSGRATAIPAPLLQADELLLDAKGVLAPGTRVVGTNDVGMVGWHATLKTPEYPEGRPLVIVANDCTVQSGSFGVKEDEFFDSVSKYARAEGLPRLHIACNSGARIGLAEELKPYFQVAWNDPNNEANGYKYLYLSEEDAGRFAEGVFHGDLIMDEGEKRFKLEDIVGETDGIGVENLRGSGMIAGETSAAYEETFTLSYVTGRSV